MKEVFGNIWDYPADYVVITTNGDVRRDGAAVMGRGVALQAKSNFPGMEYLLGKALQLFGSHVRYLESGRGVIVMFPVKHHWREKADLALIAQSAVELTVLAMLHPDKTFVLPRPGCGNGGLTWKQVKPIIESVLPDNVHVITLEE